MGVFLNNKTFTISDGFIQATIKKIVSGIAHEKAPIDTDSEDYQAFAACVHAGVEASGRHPKLKPMIEEEILNHFNPYKQPGFGMQPVRRSGGSVGEKTGSRARGERRETNSARDLEP